MISPVSLIAVVLVVLLVGATIPVLYQMYQTLKKARAFMDSVAPRLATTLDQVGHAADRLNRAGATFESQTLAPLLGTGFKVGRSIWKSLELLRTATAVAGAVGPGVLAGVRALLTRPDVRPMKREF